MTTKRAESTGTAPGAAPQERRADERVAARFEVHFQHVQEAARALRAYTLNLSVGGLCLRTQRSYEVGSRVHLQMTVEGEAFELEGIVAWVHREAEAIGVRFVNLSDETRRRLQHVVNSFKR